MFPSNGIVVGPGGKFLGRRLRIIYFANSATTPAAKRQSPALKVAIIALDRRGRRAIVILWGYEEYAQAVSGKISILQEAYGGETAGKDLAG